MHSEHPRYLQRAAAAEHRVAVLLEDANHLERGVRRTVGEQGDQQRNLSTTTQHKSSPFAALKSNLGSCISWCTLAMTQSFTCRAQITNVCENAKQRAQQWNPKCGKMR